MLLQGSNQATYGDMMLDYHKAYANKQDHYPKNIQDMVDTMWQEPKRYKKNPESQNKDMKNCQNDSKIYKMNQVLGRGSMKGKYIVTVVEVILTYFQSARRRIIFSEDIGFITPIKQFTIKSLVMQEMKR